MDYIDWGSEEEQNLMVESWIYLSVLFPEIEFLDDFDCDILKEE